MLYGMDFIFCAKAVEYEKQKKRAHHIDSINSLISSSVTALILLRVQCLTIIIAGAQMSSESLAHEAEG